MGWADDKGWTHLNFLGSAMAISMGGTRGIIRGQDNGGLVIATPLLEPLISILSAQ